MANQIVRSRVPVRGSKKRSTQWAICSVPTGLSVCAASTKCIAVLVPSTTLLDLVPFTITRTIVELHISSDQSGASECQIGALGFGVVNRVAGALGITGLPGPATDCGWPGWFAHRFFTQEFLFITGTGTEEKGREYHIDSRAQRKVETEEDIVAMIENFDANNGIAFGVSFRMLLKAG